MQQVKLWRCSVLTFLLMAVTIGAQADERSPNRLIFTSDPQFPWTESSDNGGEESASDRDKRSRWLIETQYSDVASYRKFFNREWRPIPVMINGDLTAFGHSGQRSTTKEILDKHLGGITITVLVIMITKTISMIAVFRRTTVLPVAFRI